MPPKFPFAPMFDERRTMAAIVTLQFPRLQQYLLNHWSVKQAQHWSVLSLDSFGMLFQRPRGLVDSAALPTVSFVLLATWEV